MKGFVSGVGLALLCLVAGTARFVWGDVIELKTGQRVEGNFKQATPNGVVIEVGGQDIRFKTDQVRAIYTSGGLQVSLQGSLHRSRRPSDR